MRKSTAILKVKRGFTLSELLVVLVIVGIIVSFAIPNFSKSVERAQERDAIVKLVTIRSAAGVYKIQTGSYPTTALPDENAINATLGTEVKLGVFTSIACDLSEGFKCSVQDPDGWEIHFHEDAGGVPTMVLHCMNPGDGTGQCPTCQFATPCGGQD